jgi:hypothetical protein
MERPLQLAMSIISESKGAGCFLWCGKWPSVFLRDRFRYTHRARYNSHLNSLLIMGGLEFPKAMNDDQRIPRTDLPGYFKGLADRLAHQVRVLTPVIVHSGEMGDNDHLWFTDLLRNYLPTRIGLGTGFVVNAESDKASAQYFAAQAGPRQVDKSVGPQSDILLLDVLNNAPFCPEKSFVVVPVEMVLGVVEVTRHLDAAKLQSDLEKLSRVRQLGKAKHYRPTASSYSSAPFRLPLAYLVGMESSLSEDEITRQVGEMDASLRPDAILMLDKHLLIRKRSTTQFIRVEKDILYHFVAVLRAQVESFPLGSTDLGEYLPIEGMVIWGPPGGMSSSSAGAADFKDSF